MPNDDVKIEDILLKKHNYKDGWQEGVYIGSRTKGWALAMNMDREFVVGGGFNSSGNKTEKDSPNYINSIVVDWITEEHYSDEARTVKNVFFVPKDTLKELKIENREQLSQLCHFTANCYDVAQNVISQMCNNDFHAFVSYQEELAKIATLQQQFPGIPMSWSPPKTR